MLITQAPGPNRRSASTRIGASLLFLTSVLNSTAAIADQWLLIAPKSLMPSAQPLVELREQQGFQVTRVASDGLSAQEVLTVIQQSVKPEQKSYVLLLGCWQNGPTDGQPHVVPLLGQHGRMTDLATDYRLGLPNAKMIPQVAVGRLPARNPAEAAAMVAKTIRCDQLTPGIEANRISLIVGHPGGFTTVERRLSESVVQYLCSTKLGELDPMWSANCLIDMPNTVFTPSGDFGTAALNQLNTPHLISLYFGHSGAARMATSGSQLDRDKLASSLNQLQSPSLMFSCGCYSCQLSGKQGHLLAAIRNPRGPAMAIGAFEESYSVAGRLALDGLTSALNAAPPPQRIGDYYRSIQSALAVGKISPLMFYLFDQADGSRGQTSLEEQRKEHLEMWTLMGDPALKLPIIRASLEPTVTWTDDSIEVVVRGKSIPSGAQATVVLESRHASSSPSETAKFGAELARVVGMVEQGRVHVKLPRPQQLPSQMVVRAWVDSQPIRLGVTRTAPPN